MKNSYEKPQIIVNVCSVVDVICTSDNLIDDNSIAIRQGGGNFQ